ncbi:MAG: hypothetical protein ACJAZW_000556 [Maritalea sp.]|jgi:hypothetical protein
MKEGVSHLTPFLFTHRIGFITAKLFMFVEDGGTAC